MAKFNLCHQIQKTAVKSLRQTKNPQGSVHFLLAIHISPATHKSAPSLFQKKKYINNNKEDPGLLPCESF